MYLLSNVGKKYGEKWALRNVTLAFPEKGLVAIKGKSGSGKSTLLNLMSLLEKPSEGRISYLGNDISKLKEKDRTWFHSYEHSFVFQHFNLEDELTVRESVEMPLFIRGENKKLISEKTSIVLKKYGLFAVENKKTKLLSGGEKQRVALCRALITEPKVLFADEPTGALDKVNEKIVLDELKELSKNILVVMVSHNERLISKYADEVIELSDGRVVSHPIYYPQKEIEIRAEKRKASYSLLGRLLSNNYRGNKLKNALSLISGTIGFLFILLSLGFYAGSKTKLGEEKSSSLLYTSANVYKSKSYEIEGSPLSLSQVERPTQKEIIEAYEDVEGINIVNDYSFFLPTATAYECNGFQKEPATFRPILDLSLRDREKDFLVKGMAPSGASLNYVLVNEEFEKNLGEDAIGKKLTVNNTVRVSEGGVFDDIELSFSFRIAGVVHEFSFLNTPRVYYSFPALEQALRKTELPKISESRKKPVNIVDYVTESSNTSQYTGYSYLVFFPEKRMEYVESLGTSVSGLTVSNEAFTINKTFETLTDAFTECLIPYLLIEVASVSFILGSLSYSSFVEKKKQAAILSVLGASQSDRSFIYEGEGYFNAMISSLLALVLSIPIQKIASSFLEKEIGISGIINIPYLRFMGVPYLPIIGIVLFALVIAFVGCSIPLAIASKRPLVEELRDE